MFKFVKLLILLIILVCAVIGAYLIVQAVQDQDAGGGSELRSRESESSGVRVEEKYGFTSEGVEP
ncbi:MAG: hypothetical protein ABIG44_13390 [Planctomycetota bacterium]